MAIFAFLKAINPRAWLYAGAFAVLSFLGLQVWGFVAQALEDRQTIIQQELTIELKQEAIETLQFRMAQAEEAQRIAEEARLAAEVREDELQGIRDAAVAAGDERDGELAPVLQDTLRALRGNGD